MAQPLEEHELLEHMSPPISGSNDQCDTPMPASLQRSYTIPRKAIASKVSIRQLSISSGKDSVESDVSYDKLPQSEWPREQADSTHYRGDAWLPGWWDQLPHNAFWSLFGCLLCLMACIIVLAKSNGREVGRWTYDYGSGTLRYKDNWAVSPAVILSILVSLLNILARFAFREGVKISWWQKALRGGTIDSLHHHWSHTDSFKRALMAGRNFNLITLSSIAVTLLIVDQPLIQRASSVGTATRNSTVDVTLQIAPEVPWGYTGYRGLLTPIVNQVMTQPMISVFNEYNTQAPIKANFSGCEGTCVGSVEAAGLSARCSSKTGPIKYYFDNLNLDGDSITNKPFSVNFSLDLAYGGYQSQIAMDVAYTKNSNSTSCSGTRVEMKCMLAPATMRYPVTFVNGTVILPSDVTTGALTQSFQPPESNSTYDQGEATFYTLGGLFTVAKSLFTSTATYALQATSDTPVDQAAWWDNVTTTLPDTLSNQFLDLSNQTVSGQGNSPQRTYPYPTGCGLNWTDPTLYIINSLNNMMFRLSLSAANVPFRNTTQPPSPTKLQMNQSVNVNVYLTNWRYMGAMVAVTFALLLLILPTFEGWQYLGRQMSLNPLEIAKAFDAPLFQGPGSNTTLSGLVEIYGKRTLRYGEVECVEGGTVVKKLKFADPSVVARPMDKMKYD